MTTRLNQNLRDKITQNALAKAGITAVLAELEAKRRAWTEAARVCVNGATDAELMKIEREIAKHFKKLPENVRPQDNEILSKSCCDVINLAGITVRLEFKDAEGSYEHRIRTSVNKAVIEASNPLVQQFHDLDAEEKALNEKATTLRLQVKAALNKVTTVKKLLDLWPEAKELLPENLEEAKVNLPALAVADLNNLIGLPSEQEPIAA